MVDESGDGQVESLGILLHDESHHGTVRKTMMLERINTLFTAWASCMMKLKHVNLLVLPAFGSVVQRSEITQC